MENLSPIAEAIRHYKLNASGGYDEWSKVPRAPDYKMHVPSMDFNVTGHDEVREVIFGWLTDIGAQQELVNIVEFGSSVTCYLHITDKEGAVLDIVEVFQIDDQGGLVKFGRFEYIKPPIQMVNIAGADGRIGQQGNPSA